MIRFASDGRYGGLIIRDTVEREPHSALKADGEAYLFLPDVVRLYEALGEYLAERGVKP